MSGPPPGPGGPGARSMSVSNGPPSAGMPPPQHMQSQQANVPPPAGASGGSQSQQNLNQIVGPFSSSYLLFALSSTYYPPTATGSPLEPNSMKSSHAEADVSNMSTLNPPPNAHSKGSYAQHMESTRKYLEHPCAFTKFENGHPQPPGTYCQNLHLECNFGDPRPAPQYRPKRDKYRPSCGPCWQSNVPCSGVYHPSREHVFICSNCLNTSTRCYYGTQDGKTTYPKYPTSSIRILLPHYEQIVELGRGTYSP